MDNLTNQSLIEFISGFPQGVSAGEIKREFKAPRTSLNRRLRELIGTKQLVVTGKGPTTLQRWQ